MKICGIYKITSPIGKVYIGSSKDIMTRVKHYIKGHSKAQIKLYQSLTLYGWDAHKLDVLEECDPKVLFERERFYQELYDSMDNGLNMTLQATKTKKGICGADTRKKMSDKLKGNKHALGMKHSDEAKKRISAANKGKSWNNGYKHTAETKIKMSLNSPRKGKPIFESLRQAIINRNKECMSKIVLDTNTGIFYESIKFAAQCHGMKKVTLAAMLSGRNRNKTSLILA